MKKIEIFASITFDNPGFPIFQHAKVVTVSTWIGPIACRSSFSLLGVIVSGKEPITTRFEGLPLLDALVTTTRAAFESGVELDVLLLLSEGPTTMRCKNNNNILINN